MMAAILSLLLAGCGQVTMSVSISSSGQLIKDYPWIATLGLAFIKGLLERFGYDLPDLLAAAAAALPGG